MTKTFSVITPTSNSIRFIDETIQSVILQRGNFYVDYIVIDNCSTDGTLELIKEYQEKISKGLMTCNCKGVRFRYVSEKDNGMYEAIVKGIEMCEGDYFSYINSDDFYLPNAFATIDWVFRAGHIKWLTGLPGIYAEAGSIRAINTPCVYKSSYIRRGVYGKYLPHIQQESTFWKKELCSYIDLDKLSGFKYAGDFYLWHSFAESNHLFTVNAQLSGFRMHQNNLSNDMVSYNQEVASLGLGKLTFAEYIKIQIYKRIHEVMSRFLLRYMSGVINIESDHE